MSQELIPLNDKLQFILEESIPKEQAARKKYVSDISLFYGTIFKSKLEHFIGEQLLELSQIGRSEELNNVLRANINCFRLIDKWMEKMTNEHFGNQQEVRNALPLDKDFISNMRDKYDN